MNWSQVELSKIAEINPRNPIAKDADLEQLVSFVPMAAVSEETYRIEDEQERPLREVCTGFTPFKNEDVIVAKITPCFENGKMALVDIKHELGFGSTEFHVLRADTKHLLPKYLYHFARRDEIRSNGEKHMTGSAGQRRVPRAFWERLEIPLPPLPEQQRIAAILDQADALRTKRRAALAKLDTLLQATFLHMFGDPVTNPMGWPVKPLGDIAQFVGGGTPSREKPEYFSGDICWATSKDMKGEFLYDTQEHITQEAIDNSATKLLPAGNLLIVVKSKILMHRLPVLINCVATCFGQDLKGAIIDSAFPTTYVARHMRIGQRSLIHRARGVNTEGLTLEHLRNYTIMAPPSSILGQWEKTESTIMFQINRMVQRERFFDNLFHSLQQRAFKGEL